MVGSAKVRSCPKFISLSAFASAGEPPLSCLSCTQAGAAGLVVLVCLCLLGIFTSGRFSLGKEFENTYCDPMSHVFTPDSWMEVELDDIDWTIQHAAGDDVWKPLHPEKWPIFPPPCILQREHLPALCVNDCVVECPPGCTVVGSRECRSDGCYRGAECACWASRSMHDQLDHPFPRSRVKGKSSSVRLAASPQVEATAGAVGWSHGNFSWLFGGLSHGTGCPDSAESQVAVTNDLWRLEARGGQQRWQQLNSRRGVQQVTEPGPRMMPVSWMGPVSLFTVGNLPPVPGLADKNSVGQDQTSTRRRAESEHIPAEDDGFQSDDGGATLSRHLLLYGGIGQHRGASPFLHCASMPTSTLQKFDAQIFSPSSVLNDLWSYNTYDKLWTEVEHTKLAPRYRSSAFSNVDAAGPLSSPGDQIVANLIHLYLFGGQLAKSGPHWGPAPAPAPKISGELYRLSLLVIDDNIFTSGNYSHQTTIRVFNVAVEDRSNSAGWQLMGHESEKMGGLGRFNLGQSVISRAARHRGMAQQPWPARGTSTRLSLAWAPGFSAGLAIHQRTNGKAVSSCPMTISNRTSYIHSVTCGFY